MSSGEDFSQSSDVEEGGDCIDPFTEQGYRKVSSLCQEDARKPEFKKDEPVSVFDPHHIRVPTEYKFRQRISKNLQECNEGLLNAIASHRDLLYLEERPDVSHDIILNSLAAHCLDYLMNVRDRIIKNNTRLAKDASLELRDQGFARPRILFLCPFKNTAFKLVSAMMKLWMGKESVDGQVEQKGRFTDEYGRTVDSDGRDVEEDISGRPEDYQHTFAGNIDDCFRIGIKMTRKALKLYADFYSADILIASPLGLKLVIDGQDQRGAKKDDKRKRTKIAADHDFLSSIECVIVDQADVICMQNWEHLVEIYGKLNLLPIDPHGCDFSRVMSVFLDGRGRRLRQSVFLSSFSFPELLGLFRQYSLNIFGAVRVESVSSIPVLPLSNLRPEFHWIPAETPQQEAEARLTHFRSLSLSASHTCIFTANYFEFLRLKSLLGSSDMSFEAISEYTDQPQATRARSRFYNGHARLLLVTERFHFYHRFSLKGIRRLVFYSLPMYPVHFREWVEMVQVKTDRVRIVPVILVSRFDTGKVRRIFGEKGCEQLFKEL